MKISANVWNKFTDAEKDLFRLYCNNHGSNDIKRLIKAITVKFGAVENVKLHAYSKVTFNSSLYIWDGHKTWYEYPSL